MPGHRQLPSSRALGVVPRWQCSGPQLLRSSWHFDPHRAWSQVVPRLQLAVRYIPGIAGALLHVSSISFNSPPPPHHDDVIKWKHFSRNWSFVRGIHRSPVNSPHKGQWRRALLFSLICTWISGWVNNLGDLRRRHRVHYGVTVMTPDKMVDISQMTFSNAFSWMNKFVFRLEFHWSLSWRVPIDNKSALVQVMAWRLLGAKPLHEAMLIQFIDAYMWHCGKWVN